MFKLVIDKSPEVIRKHFFAKHDGPYHERQRSCSCVHSVNGVFNGTKSIRFLGPDISNVTPDEMKHLENRGDFKIAIKE